MFKFIISSAVLSLLMLSWTYAAVIDVGTHYILPDDVRTIPITVSGGDPVRALDFFVQVADGGSDNYGTATKPVITAINIIGPGTIFSPSNVGSHPASLPEGMIWSDSTNTQPGVTIAAAGTLAYVTVNTAGTHSTDAPYALSVANVAANYMYPDYPLSTDFGDITPTINEGQIIIVDLHDMIWNKSGSGVWTEHTWTGSLPPYPNYTARATVNTPYNVAVNDAEEANKLTITGAGSQVSIAASGSLAVTTSVNVSAGGTLSVAAGAKLTATGIILDDGTIAGNGSVHPAVTINAGGGTLAAPLASDNLILDSTTVDGAGGLTKTGLGTATLLGNALYLGDTTIDSGRLQLDGANSSLDAITGDGTLGIGNGASHSVLTAKKIDVNVLELAPGAELVIAAIPGGPLSSGDIIRQVPEPSTLVLAAIAGLLLGLRTGIPRQFRPFLVPAKHDTP